MIAPLRRRHRRLVTALALLLPVGLAASLAARPPAPVQAILPPGIAPPSPPPGLVERPLAGAPALAGRRLRLLAGDGDTWIELAAAASDEAPPPDALVLWSPEVAADPGAPPDSARFLGTLGDDARAYLLPAEAGAGGGWLLLYSLGHAALVDQLALPGGPPP